MGRRPRDKKIPQFFKVFLANSSQRLMLPPRFRKHLAGVVSGTKLSLKGPNGGTWRVELVVNSEGVWFQSGWREFVTENSVSIGDFLLFKYDGRRTMTVLLFDSSCCERPEGSSHAGMRKNAAGPNENEGAGTSKALVLSGDAALQATLSGSKKRESSEAIEGSSRKKKFAPLDKIMAEETRTILVPKKSKMNTNVPNSSIPASILMPPPKCVVKCEANSSGQISLSNPLYSSGGGASELPINDYSKTLALVNSGEMPLNEKVQVQRVGPLISQRRPVTEEEIDKTVEKSMTFKSDNPFVSVIMRDSHVYSDLYVNLPGPFAKRHLPRNGKITLWDSDGNQWTVAYSSYKNRGGLCAGWGKFAYAHNLEKDDICIFELIQKGNLRVHVFRVVEELTPLMGISKN